MVTFLGLTAACQAGWYFEAGPLYRGGMNVDVSGGSHAAQAGMQVAQPGTRGGMANAAPQTAGDDGSAQVLRTFDNGYVGPSGWAWARDNDPALSQYFGYNDAAQYNASAKTLSFTRETDASSTVRRTVTTIESTRPGWSGGKDLDGLGAQLTWGYAFPVRPSLEVSVQAQLGWLDGMEASFRDCEAWRQQSSWTAYQSTMSRIQNWTYTYDTFGNPAIPGAPYAMTDPSGMGPMIADRPMSIVQTGESLLQSDGVVGRGGDRATSRVDLDADMQAVSLMLGSRVRWTPVSPLSVMVQAGGTFNLLDADLSRQETFVKSDGTVLGCWTDSHSEQKWLPGASLAAGLQWNATSRLYIQADAGYDWVKRTGLSIGPDTVKVDLSGVRAELAIGWRIGL